MGTRERLDRKMDPLMALQIVIAIEALWALITFERPISGCRLHLLRWLTAVHCLCICRIAAVVPRGDHALLYSTNHGHLSIGTVDVGHDWAWHWRQ